MTGARGDSGRAEVIDLTARALARPAAGAPVRALGAARGLLLPPVGADSLALVQSVRGVGEVCAVLPGSPATAAQPFVLRPERSLGMQVLAGRLPGVLGSRQLDRPGPELAEVAMLGARRCVVVPVTFTDGRLFGALVVGWRKDGPAPGHALEAVRGAGREVAAALSSRRVDDLQRRHLLETLRTAGPPELSFQPVVDLASGDTRSWAAYARFPRGSADEVFGAARAVGVLEALEMRCLQRGVSAVLDTNAKVGVRLSARTIMREDVQALLGRAADRMTVLLPARDLVERPSVVGSLRALRRTGVTVGVLDAVDGTAVEELTGVVSSWQLRRGLLREPPRRTTDAVKGLLAKAERAQAVVEAPGLETLEDLSVCVSLGVPLGSGFALSPLVPLPRNAS